MAILAITTFVCGVSGYIWLDTEEFKKAVEGGDSNARFHWSVSILKALQLFLLNTGTDDDGSNWLLEVARWSTSALFAVVSSTVILRVLDDIRRLPRLITQKGHIVICGLGEIGLQLLDDLNRPVREARWGTRWLARWRKVPGIVVIENNPANTWLEYVRLLGASVVIGDSTQAGTLKEARTHQAKEVFVVNGDDGLNLEVAAELETLLKLRSPTADPVKVFVHIVDVSLATTLSRFSSSLHVQKDKMHVQVFNVLRNSAVNLVVNKVTECAPHDVNEVVHFVIIGFDPMGQALAVQLAQLGHFSNRKRSRFTIVDRDIQKAAAEFLSRFSRFTSWTPDQLGVQEFSKYTDDWDDNKLPLPDGLRVEHDEAIQYVCNARFAEQPLSLGDEQFALQLVKELKQPRVKPIVLVCDRQDRENFDSAVQLQVQLARQDLTEVPFFVWMPHQPALAATLPRIGLFHSFGECRTSACYDEITSPPREKIGRMIHDDYENRAVKNKEKPVASVWSETRDDFRESNRVAADHLIIKLAAFGYRLLQANEPDSKTPVTFDDKQIAVMAEMEHNRWVAERLLAGWQYVPMGTPEEIKENKKRNRNHNLVPWAICKEPEKDIHQVSALLESFRYRLEKIPKS